MHSVEALLLHGKGKENVSYHQRHLDLKRDYEKRLPTFFRDTEDGTIPDASIRSVYNASTFDRCKPMDPTFMKLGWYDRHADIIMTNNDPVERGADAPEFHAILHPSSSDKPSSSTTCKNDEPIQSKKRKHVVSVMIPTLSSLKLQHQMFVIIPSSSKPTSSGREGYYTQQNDCSSAMQTSQSISSKPSTTRNSVPAKTAPRSSSSAINQSTRSTATSRKGNQHMHANRPATNPSAMIISPASANRTVPAKTGIKSSPSVDQSSYGNGPRPSGSKPPQYRFSLKETVSGISLSEPEDEDKPSKRARWSPSSPSQPSQTDVFKRLSFNKKSSPVSENKGKPLRSSGVEQNPMPQSLVDAYNYLGVSERPEASSSLSNSNSISQASVIKDSRGGSPSPDSQQSDPSNPANSDNMLMQTSTHQTNAGVSTLGLYSTPSSSRVDVPMADDMRSQIGLQREA
ncbi:hypothetical protein DFS33DRAFT_337306 [Desarmillaria ectypa]|nr:hypothetical protein DFS33DRAFT_337306 [Desarmillaria ectypa]